MTETSTLYVVASGEYEQYSVHAAFTTREKAEAYAAALNALAVKYAGFPGLSCETPERAATSYWVEDGYTLPIDPAPWTQWPQEWLDRAGWIEPAAEDETPTPHTDE